MSKHTPRHLRLIIAGVVLALICMSCSATETVILNEAAVEAAAERAAADEPTPSPEEPAESRPAIEPTAPPATADVAEPPERGEDTGDCEYLGVDGFGDMQIQLVFASDITDQTDASASYEVLAADGVVLVESSTFLEDVLPGERLNLLVDTLEDGPLESDDRIMCRFLGLESFDFGDPPFRPSDFDLCSFAEIDDFGDIQIELVVTNPTGIRTELAIDYALRGPDGVRFDDGVTFSVDEVSANEQLTLQVDTFTDFPDWVDTASFTCDILAIEEF